VCCCRVSPACTRVCVRERERERERGREKLPETHAPQPTDSPTN
jgi:hypothetical protein